MALSASDLLLLSLVYCRGVCRARHAATDSAAPTSECNRTTVTYDEPVYDYRYTPEEFPFAYDKAL